MKAIIVGVAGQLGSYLTELLLSKGYEVHGVARQPPLSGKVDARVNLSYDDGQYWTPAGLVAKVRPDEVYFLAAQSSVGASWEAPQLTAERTGLAVLRWLDAVRFKCPTAHFFHASSGEMFGPVGYPLDDGEHFLADELTSFRPRSPYACAKVYAHQMVQTYREAYKLWAVNGIMFNAESPRRPMQYLTRKISFGAVSIAAGRQDKLPMGNLQMRRDWGYAGDYAEAMWMMLQAKNPKDYVIATGQMASVEQLCQRAFERVGINDWAKFLVARPSNRPLDYQPFGGNSTAIQRDMGWKPTHTWEQVIDLMVDAEAPRNE